MIAVFLLFLSSLQAVSLDDPVFAYQYQEQVEKGASAFLQSCYSCHSMSLLRTDPVSLKAGIDPKNAPVWSKDSWNGHPPPDLSLVTAYRGLDHVYSYLRAYYKVDTDAGYDNLVIPGTQMPNPFAMMQGDQIKVMDNTDGVRLFRSLELVRRGSMNPQEFDDYVTSIVAYLNYASDPSVEERHHYGVYVIGFLVIFVFIMIFLDIAYWRDIHHHRK
tara:strand:- start:2313 stop:2963 length:651 start_codon:yes stop_codon:yes gene_type:complete